MDLFHWRHMRTEFYGMTRLIRKQGRFLARILATLALVFSTLACPAGTSGILAEPAVIHLNHSDREHGLIVSWLDSDGLRRDITRETRFKSLQPNIVSVDESGRCRALQDGIAQIVATYSDRSTFVHVEARDTTRPYQPSFRQDILPILTRNGCNAGGCHGKLSGQNGFRLSLRGFAPDWDYDWIVNELGSRRVNFAFPELSLLVAKPSGGSPHEGGTRFRADSLSARTLTAWIAARAPGPVPSEPSPDRIEVLPGSRDLRVGERQQLLVRAYYPTGRVRDVSWLAQFFSNDDNVVSVKPDGRITARGPGRTSVRVHFQNLVEAVGFTIPFDTQIAETTPEYQEPVIDEPVFSLLHRLRLPPSPLCDDGTFLRRAFLDATGTLPSPEEVEAFARDRRSDKRARWIDELLERPEWVDHWTLQLADLLQNRRERDHDVRGIKGVRAFHSWLRAQLAANRGWDAIARDILTAQGDVRQRPEIGYFITLVGEHRSVEESELPDSVAQAFLGTRIGCARCHNHPLERYTQDDFYHFSASFAKVRLEREKPDTGLTRLVTTSREEAEQIRRLAQAESRLDAAREFALAIGEEPGSDQARQIVRELEGTIADARKQRTSLAQRPPTAHQPRTSRKLEPRPIDGGSFRTDSDPRTEPRETFANWMVQSPLFAGAMVNRLWKHFLGTGLVEPVDDLRVSNPPSNPELWSRLNREWVEHQFDLKHLMRMILNSRTYQSASTTLPGNANDTRFYSHYYARRLSAEILLDAMGSATGSPAAFAGYPIGLRAIQLAEPGVGSYFLTLFGRSDRVTACACERKGEVTLPQLLHVRNSDDLRRQIEAPEGRLAAVLTQSHDREAVDSLFLSTLSRRAKPSEWQAVDALLEKDCRESVLRDLLWALLNSKEFAFNH